MEKNNQGKVLFTEEDFAEMSWHDCKIYAMAFESQNFELLFDIDYIVEWVTFNEENPSYKFLISPATLVFRNVYDINITLDSVDFQILDVNRDNPVKPKNAAYINESLEYDWSIETTNGSISFKSVGYKQYSRKPPKLFDRQSIGVIERGGIAFKGY